MPSDDRFWFDPPPAGARVDVAENGAPPPPSAGRLLPGLPFGRQDRAPDDLSLDGPDDVDPDDDLLALDEPGPRAGRRLRAVLAVALLATAGFTAGAWLQKRTDAQTVATAAAVQGRAAGFAGRGGQGGQGFQGFGGAGANTSSGGSSGGSAAGSAASAGPGGSGSGVPVLVGSLTSLTRTAGGADLAVTDLGGHHVAVTVTSSTVVTAPGPDGPRAGEAVMVYGTRPATGPVRAAAVVARPAAG